MQELKAHLLDSYKQLVLALKNKRLTNSLIIGGDVALGSIDLALYFTKLYLCHENGDEPCNKCKSCVLFESASHPDFRVVLASSKEDCDKNLDIVNDLGYVEQAVQDNTTNKVIRIDSIRTINHYLYESAVLAHNKAAIIANAHLMQEGAANSLLKTFEEPPANTLIILQTNAQEKLIPTILSRAYKLNIKKPSYEMCYAFLKSYNIDDSRIVKAIGISSYNPNLALDIINLDNDKLIEQFITNFVLYIINPQSIDKENKCIQLLLDLEPKVRDLFLNEFIVQILKYKVQFSLDNLCLLDEQNVKVLYKIKKDKLFKAYSYINENLLDDSQLLLKLQETRLRELLHLFKEVV